MDDDELHPGEIAGTRRRQRAISAGIYGLIVSTAVAAVAGEHGTVKDVTLSVLVAVFVYWLADAYSEALSLSVIDQHTRPRTLMRGLLTERWALVEASFVPLLVMIVARAFGAGTNTAINLGLFTATALLGVIGWIAATRRGSRVLTRLGLALVTAGFGLVMIALKTILHT
jgi:hypothetical protein